MHATKTFTKALTLAVAMLAILGVAGAGAKTVHPTDRISEVTKKFRAHDIAYVEIKTVSEVVGKQRNQELRLRLVNPTRVAKVHFKKGAPASISLPDLVLHWDRVIGHTGSMTVISRASGKVLLAERIGSINPVYNNRAGHSMTMRYRSYADMRQTTTKRTRFGSARNVRIVIRPHAGARGAFDAPHVVPGKRSVRADAGFTPTMPFTGDQQLTQGLLAQTAQPVGSCISLTRGAVTASSTQATTGQIWVSTSASEVESDLQVGGSVSYNGGLFSADASASYSTTSTASSNSVYVYTKVHSTKSNQALGTKVTTPWTGTTPADALDYLNRCGDAVPVTVNYGATYDAVVRLDTSSSSEQSSVAASLSGSYGGAKVSAEMQQSISSKASGTNAFATQTCVGPSSGSDCTGANGSIDISSGDTAISDMIKNYNYAFSNLGSVTSTSINDVVYQPIWAQFDATSTGDTSVLANMATAVQAVQGNAQDWALGYNETANAYLYAARNPQFYSAETSEYYYEAYYYYAALALGLSTWAKNCAAGQLTSTNAYQCASVYTKCATAPDSNICLPSAYSDLWTNIEAGLRDTDPAIDPDPTKRSRASRSNVQLAPEVRRLFDPPGGGAPDPNRENLLPPTETYPETCDSFVHNNTISGGNPVNGVQTIFYKGNPNWRMKVVCTWTFDGSQFHGTAWLQSNNAQVDSWWQGASFPYMKYHELTHTVEQTNNDSSTAFDHTVTGWGFPYDAPESTKTSTGAMIRVFGECCSLYSGVTTFGGWNNVFGIAIDTSDFGWYYGGGVTFTNATTSLEPAGCTPGGSTRCKAFGPLAPQLFGTVALGLTDSSNPGPGLLSVQPFPSRS